MRTGLIILSYTKQKLPRHDSAIVFLPNNVHDVKTSLLPFLHITIEFEELVVNFVTDASVFVHLELVGAFGYLKILPFG